MIRVSAVAELFVSGFLSYYFFCAFIQWKENLSNGGVVGVVYRLWFNMVLGS